jgi:hypothetical protein
MFRRNSIGRSNQCTDPGPGARAGDSHRVPGGPKGRQHCWIQPPSSLGDEILAPWRRRPCLGHLAASSTGESSGATPQPGSCLIEAFNSHPILLRDRRPSTALVLNEIREWWRSRTSVFGGCAKPRSTHMADSIVRTPRFRWSSVDKEAHRRVLNSPDGLRRSEAGRAAWSAWSIQRNDRLSPPRSQQHQKWPLTCGNGARGRIRTDDLPITRMQALKRVLH